MRLRVLQFLRPSTQETSGLPDCAFDCCKTAEPDASKWGCSGSYYACLCDNPWFYAGYSTCVRESCSADDIVGAAMRIQSHCDVLNKRDLSASSSFALETNSIDTRPSATLPITTSTTSPPIVTPDGSTVISTQISTTSVTPSGISATTATSTSTSAAASPSSTHPSSGLSQSAKIGIGLGVPLGVIVLALLGYALYWFGTRRGESRGNNNTGLNNPVDDAGAMNQILQGGELHGQHVVHHPKELAGSPGSVRRELP